MKKSKKTKEAEKRIGIFEIYQDSAGLFFWRFKRGGRIVCVSESTYVRQRAARRSIEQLTGAIADNLYRVDILSEDK